MNEYHAPVMLHESVSRLVREPAGRFLDCTHGGGGHGRAILELLSPEGQLICLDQDDDAIQLARAGIGQDPRVTILKLNFGDLDLLPPDLRSSYDGVLMDLGLSSHQIDTAERGFSFVQDGPLDMRMNQSTPETAADLLRRLSREELLKVLRRGSDLKSASKIATCLVSRGAKTSFETTADLSAAIEEIVGSRGSYKVISQVFQALRMEVNGEMAVLESALDRIPDLLKPGGSLVVLTYHSGEDRLVKRRFRDWNTDCICPSTLPFCVCTHRRLMELPDRKGIVAQDSEIAVNPRARSARLRCAIRCQPQQKN